MEQAWWLHFSLILICLDCVGSYCPKLASNWITLNADIYGSAGDRLLEATALRLQVRNPARKVRSIYLHRSA